MLMLAGSDVVCSQPALIQRLHGSSRWLLACFFLSSSFSSSCHPVRRLLPPTLQVLGQESHLDTCCLLRQGPRSQSLDSSFQQPQSCRSFETPPPSLPGCRSTRRKAVLLEA